MRKMNESVEKAYTVIRHKILSGEFTAGSLLAAKHLAEEIGVSRTPVRDALRELETEGLIVLAPRQEARVKSATFDEFCDLCELRIALEVHAAALAAERRIESDMEAMRQSLETMRELARKFSETDDEATFKNIVKEDIRFHTALIEAARNRLLKDEVMRLHLIAKVMNMRPTKKADGTSGINNPFDVWKSHLRIFEEIRLQNREGAKKVMEEHIADGMKAQLKAIKDAESNDLADYM